MSSKATGRVAKPGLPKYSQIKQAFDQNHRRIEAHRLPGKQAPFRARQKAVREGCSNAAAIEIEHTALMLTREHNPPQESIASLATDKSKAQQKIKRVPTRRQMPGTRCFLEAD